MKPKAQPRPCQDSQQSKDAWDERPERSLTADSASPHDGFAGSYPDAGKANVPSTRRERPLPPLVVTRLRHGVEAHNTAGGILVNRPS